jgi:hypothetical protein
MNDLSGFFKRFANRYTLLEDLLVECFGKYYCCCILYRLFSFDAYNVLCAYVNKDFSLVL